ncbi:MAG: DUF2818 domain-containing protein [Betaproteobacteria bacterium HGW-Betaproteobacteria-22]|nr:MAG: DUF2818 domain-containing protein [Betaproteobacteria bacterium HGW-Betaproteobacteria-22]
MTTLALLAIMILAANLPWFSNKLFYCVSLDRAQQTNYRKSLAWCLLELVVLYFLMGLLVRYAEHATYGNIAPQGWEFYTVTACLFLVFAFPGFIYKVLWK